MEKELEGAHKKDAERLRREKECIDKVSKSILESAKKLSLRENAIDQKLDDYTPDLEARIHKQFKKNDDDVFQQQPESVFLGLRDKQKAYQSQKQYDGFGVKPNGPEANNGISSNPRALPPQYKNPFIRNDQVASAFNEQEISDKFEELSVVQLSKKKTIPKMAKKK